MNKQVITLAFLLVFGFLAAQDLVPDNKRALVMLDFFDEANSPVSVLVEIEDVETGEIIASDSADLEGRYELLLPIGRDFYVNLVSSKHFERLSIPSQPFRSYIYQFTLTENLLSGALIPNKLEAVIKLSVVDYKEYPVSAIEVQLLDKLNEKSYEGTTDDEGIAMLKVPTANTYYLNLPNAPDYVEMQIPDDEYVQYEYKVHYPGINSAKYPSMHKGLVNIRFTDFRTGKGIVGEIFLITSQSGYSENVQTDSTGLASIELPLDETYLFSHKYNPFFHLQEVSLDSKLDVFIMNIEYESISSVEREQYEIDRLNAIRIRDSLARNSINVNFDSIDEIMERVKSSSEIIGRNIDNQPSLFEDSEQVVLSVFERNKGWQDKLVTIDVTCSMDPYLEEVLIWQGLSRVGNEQMQIVLFNDGDGKSQMDKKIGATGGIYHVDGNEISSMISTMISAKSKGCSGDAPENDLEAIITALENHPEYNEVILVADNLSSVRDFELINDIKVPVRIILCGLSNSSEMSSKVHPQYLTLARKTNGSIHTIYEDIWDLTTLNEGEQILINGESYIIKNGEFLPF